MIACTITLISKELETCSKTLTTGTTEHNRNSPGTTGTLIGFSENEEQPLVLRKPPIKVFVIPALFRLCSVIRLCSIVTVISVLLHAGTRLGSEI